jgi:5-methylcytosine-specific restriction endonuclease McrA
MASRRYPNVHGEYRRHFPAWLRRAVFTRDDHQCFYCGRSIYDTEGLALHVDHIYPFALGGAEFDLDNLITACCECNWRFGGRRKPAAIERAALAVVAARNRRASRAA